jgi:hypothetical protein
VIEHWLFRSRSISAAACVSVAALTMLACSEATAPSPGGPSIRILPVASGVYEGDTIRLTVQVVDETGAEVTPVAVTWAVDDTNLAEVLDGGTLALLRPGTVRVTASSGTAVASYDLVIGRLVVQRVELTPEDVNMGRSDRLPVTARAVGQGNREITGRTFAFTSDDPQVAIFSGPGSIGSINSGQLVALGAGSTMIHASVDGVTGDARVAVVDLDTTFALTQLNGSLLPVLVAADSVEFDGVKEFDEVYADAGGLVLSGLLQRRYQLQVRYSQYHVIHTGDTVERELRLRVIGEHDYGIVTAGENGELSMLSELVGPRLEHTATLRPDGYLVHFREPGDTFFLDLSFARITSLEP